MCANGCRVGLWIWAVRVYHHLSLPLPLQLRPLHWLSCSMHQLDAISRMFIFYQRRWVSVVWLMGSYLIFFITCVRWLLIYVSWDRAFKRKCLISDILWKHNQKSPVSLFRESLLMCIIVYKPQIYMSVPMSQSSRYKPLWYHTWLSNSVLAAVLSTTLRPLQQVQTAAAHLIVIGTKSHLSFFLHWLNEFLWTVRNREVKAIIFTSGHDHQNPWQTNSLSNVCHFPWPYFQWQLSVYWSSL